MSGNIAFDQTYETAIKIINSRQRQARPILPLPHEDAVQKRTDPGGTPGLKGVPSIVGMAEWLEMLGYSHDRINSLNIVHVAGTKGKGSTCAFTESFMRAYGKRTGFPQKTGMYTSPHLIVPEERIRVNSVPLSREKFVQYFFEMYQKLPQLARTYDPDLAPIERGPRTLQLYALLAFHVFVREGVDIAIIETHHGGEYDATNFIQRPVVSVVTSLGMDHVDQLGPTIENIAWHKSGIYKEGAVCLSAEQDAVAIQVLQRRANDKGVSLRVVADDDRLPRDALSLQVPVQRQNASLALAATEAFLSRAAPDRTLRLKQQDVCIGVEQWSWPGRFQIIPDGHRTWFLDAAHNEMSVDIAAQWFAEAGTALDACSSNSLIFAHMSESRDSISLFRTLVEALRMHAVELRYVIFTTYDDGESDTASSTGAVPKAFDEVLRSIYRECNIVRKGTIPAAIRRASEDSIGATHIFVTGSQHLIGPALRILQGRNVVSG